MKLKNNTLHYSSHSRAFLPCLGEEVFFAKIRIIAMQSVVNNALKAKNEVTYSKYSINNHIVHNAYDI